MLPVGRPFSLSHGSLPVLIALIDARHACGGCCLVLVCFSHYLLEGDSKRLLRFRLWVVKTRKGDKWSTSWRHPITLNPPRAYIPDEIVCLCVGVCLPPKRQADALRRELAMVKDKAKAYISRLNEVNTRPYF